jgi:hypothetical protein
MGLIKLRKVKKEAFPNENPAVVKTHLRDMIVVPEMISIYNGRGGLHGWYLLLHQPKLSAQKTLAC